MEIRDFLLMMWRGVRFLAVGLFLGAILGILAAMIQPPLYEATTQVLVSRPRLQSNTDVLPLDENQLLTTIAMLVKTKPVRDAASSELGTKVSAAAIQVNALPNTLILEIIVQDGDAGRAAAIANELVKIAIEKNDSLMSERYAALEDALNAQLDQVQTQIDILKTQFTEINIASIQEQLTQVNQQIDQLKTQVSSLEQELNNLPPHFTDAQGVLIQAKQEQLAQLRSQLNLYQQIQVNLTYVGKPGQGGAARDNPSLTEIQLTLNLYQQIRVNLLNSLEANRLAGLQSTSTLIQLDPAVPPKAPVRPRPVLYVLLGGLVGFVLAGSGILITDHLYNPLKTARQSEESLGLPVLGSVADAEHGLVTLQNPLSAAADAYRTLGASIELSVAEKQLGTLMVSNAAPAEGKTAVAANLAIVYAQQGKQVILLDGDLRHPHLHKLFGIENQKGLTDIVKGSVKGLSLIPSDAAANDTPGWLDTEKWAGLLSKFQKKADLVIVESPSSDLADAQTLAAKVDAVLLVVRSGQTHTDLAQATLKRFRLAGARVIGTVLYRAADDQSLDTQIFSWLKLKLRGKQPEAAGGSETDKAPILPP